MLRFNCSQCSYGTDISSSWKKHIVGKKHLIRINGDNKCVIIPKPVDDTVKFTKVELVEKCKKLGFKNADIKSKNELVAMLENPDAVLKEMNAKPKREDLLRQCKKLGFKNADIKTKKELIYMIENSETLLEEVNAKSKREDILKHCKELGVKGVTAKSKEELTRIAENPFCYKFSKEVLVDLMKTYEKNDLIRQCKKLGFNDLETKSNKVLLNIVENPYKYRFSFVVLDEFKNNIQSNKNYCLYCSELGHKISNCIKLRSVKNVMIEYFLEHLISKNEDMSIHFERISIKTGVLSSVIKELYNLTHYMKYTQKCFDISGYFEDIYQHIQECYECNEKMYDICSCTTYTWKGHVTCDRCWSKYKDEIDDTWLKVIEYKPQNCNICLKSNDNKCYRFHYDHKNMFDKSHNIYTMVNEGRDITEIYEELDKCQSLCLQCHHLVTDIENKLGFILIKKNLSKRLNNETISVEEYDDIVECYKKIYSSKMNPIYEQLRRSLTCQ